MSLFQNTIDTSNEETTILHRYHSPFNHEIGLV